MGTTLVAVHSCLETQKAQPSRVVIANTPWRDKHGSNNASLTAHHPDCKSVRNLK